MLVRPMVNTDLKGSSILQLFAVSLHIQKKSKHLRAQLGTNFSMVDLCYLELSKGTKNCLRWRENEVARVLPFF